MDLFKRNIEYIKKNMPDLFVSYIKRKDNINNEKKKHLVEVCSCGDFKNIKLNGRLIHSRFAPCMDGKFMAEIMENDDFDTIFIMGMGLGYHLEEILEAYPDKNKIIYEPDIEVFDEYLKTFEISKIYRKNVMIIIEEEKENVLNNIIELFGLYRVYKLTFIGLPTYICEYMDSWKYITEQFVDFFSRYGLNVKTLRIYRDLWIVNYFKNLKHYPYESDLEEYLGKFKGVPGVIVSSGPSLTKNMHLLNSIKDKALIVAAGSSINALQNNNIAPHIMLGVDGSQLMSDEYNAVKDDTILFSHIMNIHPECIDKYNGPKMHIRVSSEPHIEYFEKLNDIKTTMLSTGGSCANVAMDFLYNLGCDPIILIGQDLAFPGNVTHAEGVWDRKEIDTKDIENQKSYILVKDIYGNDIYTNRVFSSFRKWFEDYIIEKEKTGKELHVINATEGGAFIQGAKHTTFKDTIDEYCKEDRNIQGTLDVIYAGSLEKSERNKEYIRKFVEKVQKEFVKIDKWSKERLELIVKLRKKINVNNKSVITLREKINKLTDKLEKNEVYQYLIWQTLHDVLYNIKNHYEDKANSEESTSEKLKILYEGLETQFSETHMRIIIVKKCLEETSNDIKKWGGQYE